MGSERWPIWLSTVIAGCAGFKRSPNTSTFRRCTCARFSESFAGIGCCARPSETITLWEVFRVLEPDPYLDACILGCGQCNHKASCALHEDWQKVRNGLVALMQTKTISEVAASVTSFKAADFSETPVRI